MKRILFTIILIINFSAQSALYYAPYFYKKRVVKAEIEKKLALATEMAKCGNGGSEFRSNSTGISYVIQVLRQNDGIIHTLIDCSDKQILKEIMEDQEKTAINPELKLLEQAKNTEKK